MRKRCKRSLEAKRKQRLFRNKRKKIINQQFKKSLSDKVKELKAENEVMEKTVREEKTIKEKYFKMWRLSEDEKKKLKTSWMVYTGQYRPVLRKPTMDLLKLEPTFLENIDGGKILGKGRFGSVMLMKFRSTPVAVKYFELSTTSDMVETTHLQQCCHINLPIIYGINNTQMPFFIVTQFYGCPESGSLTLHDIFFGKTAIDCLAMDQWLHIMLQLVDAILHLHRKTILHNDIKSDNILVVKNAGFYSPILVDFGKACLISEAKTKRLTKEEQNYFQKKHFLIAPEVINGTQPQSIKSDVYSVGIVVKNSYSVCKYKPVKEIAKRCLSPFTARCNSEELMHIVDSFM